mgnify:CR=1 FL=1
MRPAASVVDCAWTGATIAVTANALEGDEDRFLGLGFDDYLSKPFRQSQLLKILVWIQQVSRVMLIKES